MLQYLHDAAQGLAYTHSKNILHLDLKPSNILVSYQHTYNIMTVVQLRGCVFSRLLEIPLRSQTLDWPTRSVTCWPSPYMMVSGAVIEAYQYITFAWWVDAMIVSSSEAIIHYCTNTLIQQQTNTPIHQYINTPTHQYTNTPIHQYTNTSIHQYTNTSIHQYINTPIHKNALLHQYTNAPIHQYTITPVH